MMNAILKDGVCIAVGNGGNGSNGGDGGDGLILIYARKRSVEA